MMAEQMKKNGSVSQECQRELVSREALRISSQHYPVTTWRQLVEQTKDTRYSYDAVDNSSGAVQFDNALVRTMSAGLSDGAG
ncbi:hypothetical protein PsorP6_001538 [Peronosclerospora sorghi]|uniref:Uncharacterized protein n=1 Tax=Peronosclerospora sorghi TaxID=230839 RepID=A0ACC0WX23_9STRA|nr:hypothetical protein PsorP6_001538 [Peronosclerospora sorghi]